MDPNKCWDEILVDISLLHDITTDLDYAKIIQEIGENEGDIRYRLAESFKNLGEWISKGGCPPKLI